MFDRDNNLLPTADQNEDPRVWLEGVEDAGALDWVRSWNAHATSSLGDPKGSATYTKILEILDSKEKIPYVGRVLDGLYYNFWQDDVHVKGIWRRCTLAEYRKEAPAWEVVLDLDALGKAEGITWVWAGSTVLDEGAGVAVDRVLLKLSNGGSDASHVREFDLKAKAFIPESDGGFVVGEAKTQMVYKDRDTLLIGTDLGEGSLTDSGYPRTVREWKRGTKLADAPLVFEGKKTDVLAFASYYRDRHVWHAFTRRMITFWTSEHKWRTPSGEYEKVPVQVWTRRAILAAQFSAEFSPQFSDMPAACPCTGRRQDRHLRRPAPRRAPLRMGAGERQDVRGGLAARGAARRVHGRRPQRAGRAVRADGVVVARRPLRLVQLSDARGA